MHTRTSHKPGKHSQLWSLSEIAGPSTQRLVSGQYGPSEQGTVQGALISVQSLTGVVGPLIATWVFGYFLSAAAPVKIPGSPYFLGALLVVVAMLLAYRAIELQSGSPASVGGVMEAK